VVVGARGGGRARWLEPYGGDEQWRREMWGAIVALHGRYPVQLEALKDRWWTDEFTTETLCALAVWRAELDDTGHDPRDEYKAAAPQSGGSPALHHPSGPPETSDEHRPDVGAISRGWRRRQGWRGAPDSSRSIRRRISR
jgi:hypothetical protein